MDALYLVDGSNFIFRAYHALPPLSTSAGVPTGAAYGFANMLIKLEQDHRPSHLAVVFDVGKRSFRDDLYADYKANRSETPDDLVPQFALVRRVIDALAVPRVEVAGCEADDVIATLARRAREAGLNVVIVSSDKDLMQLVDDHVCLIDTMKKEQRFGPAEVEAKFGVPPSRVGDVLALMGDSIDNVPGVPGVGPKTAAALVQHFGGLGPILERLDEIARVPGLRGAEKTRAAVTANVEAVRLSRKLVALDDHVAVPTELDELRRRQPRMEEVERILRELEFDRLLERLKPKGSDAPAASATGAAATTMTAAVTRTSMTGAEAVEARPVRVIGDGEELRRVVEEMARARAIGIDFQTVAEGGASGLCGIALAADGAAPVYLPLGHRYIGAPAQVPLRFAMELLRPLGADARVEKHVHGYKQALVAIAALGLPLAGVVGDPELCAYLVDPAAANDLASVAARMGIAGVEEREALCGSGKKASAFESVEVARAASHAGRRAEATLALGRRLRDAVRAAGMERLLDEVELPLARVLAIIERHGVKLDTAKLTAVGDEIGRELAALEAEVRGLAGYEVNLGSPKQLQELLFDKLQLPAQRKTKTGFSTDAEVLEELAPLHPIAEKILRHRILAKLKGTYVDALPSLIDARTGRLHTSYNQTGAATGRISSSDPNLQNIPIRSEVGARSGARSSPTTATCWWRRTTRRSSCACWRTCRATPRCSTPSPATRTCTRARRARCSAWGRTPSATRCGGWRRRSTTGWCTGRPITGCRARSASHATRRASTSTATSRATRAWRPTCTG
jgi:DNA polymerase-1